MRLTEIIKKNAMAVVAMAIAVGSLTVMSFGKLTSDDLVWFEVENNTILIDQQVPEGPNGDCQTLPNPTICLAAFYESQLINGEEAPSSNPNDAEILARRPNH